MQKYNKHNPNGYSVVVALLMVGFLFVLTAGVLNLVLRELNDNRGMFDYIKAYAGAEAAQELALLKIKEKGYAYYDKVEDTINDRSIILGTNPLDKADFKKNIDVLISYDMDSKVNNYEGELDLLGYDIIPLFYISDSGEQKVTDLTLRVNEGIRSDIVWNIIGRETGISGSGDFINTTKGFQRNLRNDNLSFSEEAIGRFLNSSELNYLVLFNSSNDNRLKYTLETTGNDKYFTKPRAEIISTARVGAYKQNLKTQLDNTEYLNILKYAIYSGN